MEVEEERIQKSAETTYGDGDEARTNCADANEANEANEAHPTDKEPTDNKNGEQKTENGEQRTGTENKKKNENKKKKGNPDEQERAKKEPTDNKNGEQKTENGEQRTGTENKKKNENKKKKGNPDEQERAKKGPTENKNREQKTENGEQRSGTENKKKKRKHKKEKGNPDEQERAKKVRLGKRSAESPLAPEKKPPKTPKKNENLTVEAIGAPPPLFDGELLDHHSTDIDSSSENTAETVAPESVPPPPPAPAIKSVAVQKLRAGPKNEKKKESKKHKSKHHGSSKLKSKVAEKTDNSRENEDLKRTLEKLSEQVETLSNAILPMMRTNLDNWEQLKSTPAAEGRGNRLQDFGMHPHPGFLRIEDQMMHAGQGVWIHKRQYDNAKINAKSNSIFVRNMLLAIFDVEELLSSSVCGGQSNAVKVADRKPPLDPTKLVAVSDIFRFYLEEKGYNEAKIVNELAACTGYVRAKISDMTRKPTAPKEVGEGRPIATAREGIDDVEDVDLVQEKIAELSGSDEDTGSNSGTSTSGESSSDADE